MRNRKYDPDFKTEAVRLVVEEKLSIREVERNLGITFGVLKGWVHKHQDLRGFGLVGSVSPLSPEVELKQLRKENDQLRRERDILKKAVAIFSTDPHRYSGS
jgi:transposase